MKSAIALKLASAKISIRSTSCSLSKNFIHVIIKETWCWRTEILTQLITKSNWHYAEPIQFICHRQNLQSIVMLFCHFIPIIPSSCFPTNTSAIVPTTATEVWFKRQHCQIWLQISEDLGSVPQQVKIFFFPLTLLRCILILSKFFYLPTDAQENCFKSKIKIYIKTAPTCFGLISIIRERTIRAC